MMSSDRVTRRAPLRQLDLLVCTGGQASWVVGLLRALAAQKVPMQHAGDLDRSGVFILRSLRRRTGAAIEPWFMDAETHRRFADRGLPLSGAETARVGKALGREDGRGLATDVLQEVARTGVWIEQESFSDETLVPSLASGCGGRTLVITQNGKAAAVVMSPREFDALRARQRFVEEVARGLADVEAGRTQTTAAVRRAMRRRRREAAK